MSKPKFNPNKPFEVVSEKPKFDPNQSYEPVADISQIESLGRGALQGISLNFADEAIGAIESLFTDKSYEQARDESRLANQQASESNPYTYGAGELGAGLATAFIPGLNVAKGASLAAKAGNAALQGAAYGLGNSNADNISDLAKDTAIGGGIGAVMPIAIEKAIAPAFKAASKATMNFVDKQLLPKAGKIISGVDEKATANYLKNRDAVNKAPKIGELADSVLNLEDESSVLNEMKRKVSEESSNDWQTLNKATTINKQDLLSIGEDFANTILKGPNGDLTRTAATGADADALKAIYKELDQLANAYGDTLSEADLKSVVQSLQKKAYGSDTYTADKVKQLSGVFNGVLKSGNESYAQSIANTADTSKAIKEVQSIFQNRLNPENYDKFNKQVKNLINKDEQSAANKAVDKIKANTGYNLREDITNSWTKSQFGKGDINGSRKTMMGTAVGAAVGSSLGPMGALVGSGIGASVGAATDRYAGPIFKKVLDGRITAEEFLHPKFGKYGSVLSNAAKRGNQSLAATMFLIGQKDEEFRKQMMNDNQQ